VTLKVFKLGDMKGGWFMGDFEPTLLASKDFEIAVKKYPQGSHEHKHFHKISTEWTVITSGKVRMFDQIFHENDIIVIEPGEATDFTALEDTTTVVVKTPSSKNDKYLVD
jgi:quercetin dioxygenase-like cupin family protein